MTVLSFLGDLHYSTNKLAVRVTVLTKWSTITATMFRKTAMVLGDQEGSTIEATLYEELDNNAITMDEGDCFEIQNFKVIHASGNLEIYAEEGVDGIPYGLNHRMQFTLINIEKTAMVLGDQEGSTIEATLYEELDNNAITMDEGDCFEIQNFKVIHASGNLEIYAEEGVDGIPYGLNHRMQFTLINIEFVQVRCVAYGNIALQLYHYWNSTVATVVLCVLNFWRIEWGEGHLNHVSSYEGLSKLLFEPEIPEIQAFRMRISN
ncbi:hypothetical protein F2Q68_00026366 [Brassica cretica]|uniref:Replication protein A 70 kDa DNA-binding subunit B/D first OB fold domain-containing protein n=1 Tax=Brassica cretica TaxID=69181 RepID=A0A8S9ICM8_BRACR|nr:hypothetical protein F2Q68_00026366 [Brassica cretica]